MLLPLTHERAWVRRWPVVTWVIMILCVAAHLSGLGHAGRLESDRKFQEALQVVLEHPDLETDPRLVSPDMEEALALAREQLGIEAVPDRRGRAQKALDERTEAWIASLDEHPTWKHGLVPERGWQGWLSHMFMHGGWMHLIGNMLFLYLTAPVVEDKWGRGLFTGFYLVAGVLAGGGFALQYPDLFRPLVGASGAIAGVMGAFLVLYGSTRITFLLWLIVPAGTIKAPAFLMLPLWFGVNLFSALNQDALNPGGGGGVAYWAHVWGFVAGVVGALVIQRVRGNTDPSVVVENIGLDEAYAALDAGDTQRAWQLMAEGARRDPTNPDMVMAFWERAKDLGKIDAAAVPLLALVRHELKTGQVIPAVEHWYELRTGLAERYIDPALEIMLAERLNKLGSWQSAQDDLLDAAVSHVGPRTPPLVTARIVRFADGISPDFGASIRERLGRPSPPSSAPGGSSLR